MASGDERAASEQGRRWITFAGDATAFVLTLLASIAALVMSFAVEPNFRGFFCDDRTIAFPALPSTVPVWALTFACLAVPLTAVKQLTKLYEPLSFSLTHFTSFLFPFSGVNRLLVPTICAAEKE